MEPIYFVKEDEGVAFGGLSYISKTEEMCDTYEANCSKACVNIILQREKFVGRLVVSLDDDALIQAVDMLQIRNHFGISNSMKMKDIFLANWRQGEMEIFGSLIALYEVLKAEDLNLLPLSNTTHPIASAANYRPECARGYLYFLSNHWMVLRKLQNKWYKFDPWLGAPQLLTDFYLSLFVKQLFTDEELVFVIYGKFPECSADIAEQELDNILEHEDTVIEPSLDTDELELNEKLRNLDILLESGEEELAYASLLSLQNSIREKEKEEEFKRHTNKALLASASCTGTVNKTSDHKEDPEKAQNTIYFVVKRKNGTSINPIVFGEGNTNASISSIEDMCDGFSHLNSPSHNDVLSQHPSIRAASQEASGTGCHQLGVVSITSVDQAQQEAANPINPENNAEEPEKCCICWAVPPTHVIVPCGHFCLCENCLNLYKPADNTPTLCPICRQVATSITKLIK